MPLKTHKPTSPGCRHRISADFSDLTVKKPEKSLTVILKKKSGRNNQGRICIRHRGGGSRRRYRLVDFKRNKDEVPGQIISLEYDPNRSARIALVQYRDGEKRYIIAPQGLQVGDQIMSGETVSSKLGYALPLKKIPEGSFIFNIELTPGKGAQLVRSAGTAAQLLSKEKKYAQIKLPSGELRLFPLQCKATIGRVGNIDHNSIKIGKAGISRRMGRRPHVRGVAMNPVDHPHGGGEGRSAPGRHPVSPWGWPTKGKKTRKKNKASDRLIVQRRKKR